MIGLPIEELQTILRDAPKPVIAMVQGYAIGGEMFLPQYVI